MKKYTLSILAAGSLWGLMGIFVRTLGSLGISSTGAVTVRCCVAAVLFAAVIFATGARQLRIRLKDIWCFLGSGLCSMLFFTYCYFSSMEYIGLSMAAILLYTAPAIVIILSRVIFGERLTGIKLAAVIMAFAGCCFVSGFGVGASFSLRGFLLGLGAGLGYALYTIFARLAMDRGYSNNTYNFYTCLIAGLGSCLIWDPAVCFPVMFASWGNLLFCLLTGLVSYFIPYTLYAYGLRGTENGKASIMASVEPVVATLVGLIVYGEGLTLSGGAGIILVLGAVVLLNVGGKRKAELK